MPIYEYQCSQCHQVTEAWQSLADEPLTTCQTCAGPLKKLISMSSFHLKGGGWYADGYNGASTNKSCAATEACLTKTCGEACPTSTSAESCSTPKGSCEHGGCDA